ncbi:hypothetical protein KC218_29155, partial [Mycobacterium tuberculosis]|nr:hypothetical protein [Mycobacterium tuberculosis]
AQLRRLSPGAGGRHHLHAGLDGRGAGVAQQQLRVRARLAGAGADPDARGRFRTRARRQAREVARGAFDGPESRRQCG